jgi:hypothetical protein
MRVILALVTLLLLSGCAALTPKWDYVVTPEQAATIPTVIDHCYSASNCHTKRDLSQLPHGKSFCFINNNPEPIPGIFGDVASVGAGFFFGYAGSIPARTLFNFLSKANDGFAECEMWDAQAVAVNLGISAADAVVPFTKFVTAETGGEKMYWLARGAISWAPWGPLPDINQALVISDKIRDVHQMFAERNQPQQTMQPHIQMARLPPQGRRPQARKKKPVQVAPYSKPLPWVGSNAAMPTGPVGNPLVYAQ